MITIHTDGLAGIPNIIVYPTVLGNNVRQWPLFDEHEHCHSARYVGGTSGYLCECKVPLHCEGVKRVIATELYRVFVAANLDGNEYNAAQVVAGLLSAGKADWVRVYRNGFSIRFISDIGVEDAYKLGTLNPSEPDALNFHVGAVINFSWT